MKTNHKNFLKLAFNIAKVNLGKTNLNPSVGCVIVKNNSIISTGNTSKNGRPHAEVNAINNSSYTSFDNIENLITLLKTQSIEDAFVLIKGSRGMKLEQVVDYL